MKRIGAMLLGATVIGAALAGCSAPAAVQSEGTPVASSTPSPSVTEAAVEQGTRNNPIPFGQAYTFEDIGEAGGPAWKVTIDEPYDMGEEILADAVAKYGDNEDYLVYARPEAGTIFLGYTGTAERLLEYPAQPGSDLDLAIVGSDGKTYEAITMGVGGPEENIVNISDMYAPASARFSDVQIVPQGVTAAQVLVTMRNTGEAIYFGTAG